MGNTTIIAPSIQPLKIFVEIRPIILVNEPTNDVANDDDEEPNTRIKYN